MFVKGLTNTLTLLFFNAAIQFVLFYKSRHSKRSLKTSIAGSWKTLLKLSEGRMTFVECSTKAGPKALNRDNQLECIRQSIRVQLDYRLRALAPTLPQHLPPWL